ncbi:MAG: M48 family metalloprotease [Verrucomicrobia bacterium]|nr:M48 family metalloprotease [Verrucomicrobiota bacterium]MCH8528306.1 M48 family metalloprotease [Kiritimatiellia bacterium]
MNYPRRPILFVLLFLVIGYSCVTNPVTGRTELQLISEQQEISIGTRNFPYQQQIQGGVYQLDPGVNAYINEVGQKLARVSDRPHLPYEFVVLNDSSWNAWAMPGGKIGINRGLLLALSNESELAAVLAHEIVHAAARHSAQQMERGVWMQAGVAGISGLAGSDYRNLVETAGIIGLNLGMLRYSRAAEAEADYFGMLYMMRSGYDAVGAVTLQETFAENMASAGGWLASHPASIERVRRNRQTLERHTSEPGYLGEAEYRVQMRNLRQQAPAYELYEQGVKALNERPEEALRLSMEARRMEPREALFYGLSAQAHQRMNNPQAAQQAWDQAIERNPEWFLFWLERGRLHAAQGRNAAARRDLERSMTLLPTQTARDALEAL